jgi:tetratricopeptide (TPR) repeat protein
VVKDKGTLAGLYLDLSERYSVNGDLENQEAFARLALKLREELAFAYPADPADPAVRSKIASAKWAVAFAVRMRGDYDAANELFLETAEIYETLAAADENGRATHLRNAALTYKTYGAGLEAKDHIEAALEYYRKALAIDEKNAAADPLNVSGQLDLSFTMSSIASALKKLGNFNEAMRFVERSLEIQQKITTDDAANLFARMALVRSLTAKAAILAELGKTVEAEKDFKRSIELAEKISGGDPQDSDKKSLLSRSYAAIGEFYFKPVNVLKGAGRKQTLRLSETYISKGIAILEEMQSQKPLKRSSLDDLERLRKELLDIRSELEN